MIDYETQILEENPYNWRKHLIYQLPELVTNLIYITVIFLFVETFIITVYTATIESATRTIQEFHQEQHGG